MDVMMAFLETLGTIAFSVSGAIEAIKKEMDLFGVLVLGMVTAIGGGVLRDVVTGQVPPAAFQNPQQAKVAIATAVFVFFAAMLLSRHQILKNNSWLNNILFLSDAIGLGAFTILGIHCVQKEMGNDNIALLLFVGVVTGVGGGMMRDVFAGNVPYIFRKHVYATASILGAAAYLILDQNLPESFGGHKIAVIFSMLCVLVTRILAARFNWNLPKVELTQKEK